MFYRSYTEGLKTEGTLLLESFEKPKREELGMAGACCVRVRACAGVCVCAHTQCKRTHA